MLRPATAGTRQHVSACVWRCRAHPTSARLPGRHRRARVSGVLIPLDSGKWVHIPPMGCGAGSASDRIVGPHRRIASRSVAEARRTGDGCWQSCCAQSLGKAQGHAAPERCHACPTQGQKRPLEVCRAAPRFITWSLLPEQCCAAERLCPELTTDRGPELPQTGST